MGRKKKNKKIPIFLDINASFIKGTGVTSTSIEAHLGRSLIDYISSVNQHIFTLEELDNLCDDICKKLSEYNNEQLYRSVLFIDISSDSDYKKEFITFIRNMYKGKLDKNHINEIIYKFSNGVELYRRVINMTIMSNKDINERVVSFAYGVYSESFELYYKLSGIHDSCNKFNSEREYVENFKTREKALNDSDCNLIDELNDLLAMNPNNNVNNLYDDESLNNLLAKLDDEEFNKMANDIILDNKDEVPLSELIIGE